MMGAHKHAARDLFIGTALEQENADPDSARGRCAGKVPADCCWRFGLLADLERAVPQMASGSALDAASLTTRCARPFAKSDRYSGDQDPRRHCVDREELGPTSSCASLRRQPGLGREDIRRARGEGLPISA